MKVLNNSKAAGQSPYASKYKQPNIYFYKESSKHKQTSISQQGAFAPRIL